MKYLLIITILIITLSLNAEVITDGTLGQNINLPGPDFQITPNQGQQHGSNLFHSFQDFNLNSLESATFSGPNSVNNIISRVTGGNPSNIDGLIRSTIPNADFYFLNPYGIMFGPNARLDVQGSFHASTADYLRLGENGRFDARNPSDSLLTIAPIDKFGFLTDSPASISLNNSNLSVPTQRAISLIGGDLTFDKATLSAPSGRINLEGNINIFNSSLLDTSGEGGGNVFIRAGQFVIDNSKILARTQGNQDGGVIDIQADNITVTNAATIQGGTENIGNGTNIQLFANESILVNGSSFINGDSGDANTENQQLGNSSNITLQAQNILFDDMTSTSITNGIGLGGDLRLIAEKRLDILAESFILTETNADDTLAKDGGNIYLQADILNAEASTLTILL